MSNSIAESGHPHGATGAEVNNTIHMAHEGPAHILLAVLCWQAHKGHHLHAEIRAVPTKVISRVHPAPLSGAACSHDHEVFIAGSFVLAQLG